MTRGNQRELARAKNQKKQQTANKKAGAADKEGNKSMSLEARAHRDAEALRLKQQAKLAKEQAGATAAAK